MTLKELIEEIEKIREIESDHYGDGTRKIERIYPIGKTLFIEIGKINEDKIMYGIDLY